MKTIEEVLAEHGGVFAKGAHCPKNGPPAECRILEMEALRLAIAIDLARAIALDEALILAVDVWVDAASEPAP